MSTRLYPRYQDFLHQWCAREWNAASLDVPYAVKLLNGNAKFQLPLLCLLIDDIVDFPYRADCWSTLDDIPQAYALAEMRMLRNVTVDDDGVVRADDLVFNVGALRTFTGLVVIHGGATASSSPLVLHADSEGVLGFPITVEQQDLVITWNPDGIFAIQSMSPDHCRLTSFTPISSRVAARGLASSLPPAVF